MTARGIFGASLLIFASIIFSSLLALGQEAHGALQIAPSTNTVASGLQGGPFSPSTFTYTLTASTGSVNYSITNVPKWLTASSTSGVATTSGTTVTFSINSNAQSLAPGTYTRNINFNSKAGSTSRLATLTVTRLNFTVAVSASPGAGGSVKGGGTFAAGSVQTV